jgi:hypothetical protein
MKKQLYTALAMMFLIGMISVSSAKAQGSGQLTASIPFTFSVGKTTLPAGDYIVSMVNPNSDQRILQIKSKDGRSSAVMQTTGVNGKTQETGKLVFHRYGDRYFFAQAWMAADQTGLAAPKSAAERTRERELARAGRRIETVAVNAR